MSTENFVFSIPTGMDKQLKQQLIKYLTALQTETLKNPIPMPFRFQLMVMDLDEKPTTKTIDVMEKVNNLFRSCFSKGINREYSPIPKTQQELSEMQERLNAQKPEVEQPPLGCIPRWVVAEHRIKELDNAIRTYINSGKPAPIHWIEEQIYLTKNLGKWKEEETIYFKEKSLRGTGRTTKLCDEYVGRVLGCPGKWVEIEDHTNNPNNNRMLWERVIKRLQSEHPTIQIYRRETGDSFQVMRRF